MLESLRWNGNWRGLAWLALTVVLLAGCGGGAAKTAAPAAPLTLPAVEAAALGGRPLRVVATTSLIGDAVARVGGSAIALTTLMPPGQDPHSYQPAAADLAAAADADLIFVNGWNLEEGCWAIWRPRAARRCCPSRPGWSRGWRATAARPIRTSGKTWPT